MSSSLCAFLLARIAEDEQLARAACEKEQDKPAPAEHWRWETEDDDVVPDEQLRHEDEWWSSIQLG